MALIRQELCDEAIRLGRVLTSLLPDAEAFGLLALMLPQSFAPESASECAGRIGAARRSRTAPCGIPI